MQVNGQVRPAAAAVAATHRPLAKTALATRPGEPSDHRHHTHVPAHGQITPGLSGLARAVPGLRRRHHRRGTIWCAPGNRETVRCQSFSLSRILPFRRRQRLTIRQPLNPARVTDRKSNTCMVACTGVGLRVCTHGHAFFDRSAKEFVTQGLDVVPPTRHAGFVNLAAGGEVGRLGKSGGKGERSRHITHGRDRSMCANSARKPVSTAA